MQITNQSADSVGGKKPICAIMQHFTLVMCRCAKPIRKAAFLRVRMSGLTLIM